MRFFHSKLLQNSYAVYQHTGTELYVRVPNLAMLSTQQAKNLQPTKTWQRLVKRVASTTAATAQTFSIDLPRDHFIHQIIINVYESTADTYDPTKLVAGDLTNIQLVANGNKYLKDGTADMFLQVMRVNRCKPSNGLYTLFLTDPKINDAQPLPSWVFTSLVLNLTDNAPAASNYHYIDVVVVESAYGNQDLSNWKVLIEKFLKWMKYGTNTGEQLYEHERAYKVYGYLFVMDDNGTLSATAFNKLKILGRKPEGELTVVDVPVNLLVAENNAEIGVDALATGYAMLEWADGFPANEYSSLYTKPNILTAGTNIGLRVLERYTL